MTISLELKRKCVEMCNSGVPLREVYQSFCQEHGSMSYECFRHKVKKWQKQLMADKSTLLSGTYPGFIAHGATVQVNANGEIVQAWVKEHNDENALMELMDSIEEHTKPVYIEAEKSVEEAVEMLEIPLFDLHFPISDHKDTLCSLLPIVESKQWEEINIVIGQDLFHNDDLRGHTSSCRAIEQVSLPNAWDMASAFYCTLIKSCLSNCHRVNVVYSKGNHDESLGWAFTKMIKAMFPQVHVDDSLEQRKCIFWNGCFIGLTHGAYKQSRMTDLRGQFTIKFPMQFANATVREIHAGHLHREEERDIYGVMCRRLSRGGDTDQWSDDEGYVGAHKRFMVFRWKPGFLAGIDYI